MNAQRASADDALIDQLLEDLWQRHGRDFRDYQRVFVKRRLKWVMGGLGIANLAALSQTMKTSVSCAGAVCDAMCVSVTEMFRDPQVFRAIRADLLPVLRTHPFVRAWVVGCATGEEAFSLAILLREGGLTDRFRVYATDVDENALESARAGVFPEGGMKAAASNYIACGGTAGFSDYYTPLGGGVLMSRCLRDRILFSRHDLAHDGSFNSFELILCRNVLIYMGNDLRDRVHGLLYESLQPLGYLVLGQREAIRATSHESGYEVVDRKTRIYRRISP